MIPTPTVLSGLYIFTLKAPRGPKRASLRCIQPRPIVTICSSCSSRSTTRVPRSHRQHPTGFVADDGKMLFCCLTGDDPNEARRQKYEKFDNVGNQIPAEYTDPCKALYKIAATEFDKFASQRLCLVIEYFLGTVMSGAELDAFKKKAPMKFPIRKYADNLEEMEAAGLARGQKS